MKKVHIQWELDHIFRILNEIHARIRSNNPNDPVMDMELYNATSEVLAALRKFQQFNEPTK